jgi:hypothetical protein
MGLALLLVLAAPIGVVGRGRCTKQRQEQWGGHAEQKRSSGTGAWNKSRTGVGGHYCTFITANYSSKQEK